ncbi:MBL fold metallo-hydrolase [Gandjariella thermophila]|uniref:MBL fold metallo-hydrolase n=1 Tax=Gandjariella thermophila TaxID=1931992 RepID=A0A4D4JC34_9PSEU|nr:MBL fold metallo-hydrolase [Gandjariella thermophila]GDY32006.1 MBL fold metallo-hydrolase [Gandjariella thermophila]
MTGPGTLTELADGAYAYIQSPGGWCVSNAGVLRGRDGLVVIDTVATLGRAHAFRDTLEQLGQGPVRFVVNTHHHGDHIFGNCVFAPPATVIAHDAARAEIDKAGLGLQQLWPDVDWGEISLVRPHLTFPDRLELDLGPRIVELLHVGPAHTTNDIVAWLPDSRVLYAGDVAMKGVTPFVLMGSVTGSLRALTRLRQLGPSTIVCGHGQVCGPEVLDDNEEYLRWLLDVARAGVARGWTPLEAARRADLGAFALLLDPERILGNLHRAYVELVSPELPLGTELSVLDAFHEMIDFNGGRLPRCDA